MATRIKTVRYAAATRLTPLATALTLGAATRHEFASFQVFMPETTRTIVAAWVQITCRDAHTVATDYDGIRIGVRTGSGGGPLAIGSEVWDDADITLSAVDTGDHERLFASRDLTSYIEPRDGVELAYPASFDLQLAVAVATQDISAVNGITAEVFITYEYDDSATSHVKTVLIPIQSHHTTLTTAAIEVGTTGGVSDAPANQIPQLTGVGGFLPEDAISIRQSYLVVMANEAGSSGTTDFTPTITVDAAASARATIEQALTTACGYHDIVHLSEVGSPATTAAHALKAHADLTTRLENLGAVLVVTYEYDPDSTRQLVSVEVPLRSGDALPPSTAGVDWSYAHPLNIEVDVQEPGTINIKQSGAFLTWYRAGNGPTPTAAAGAQTERGYAYVNMTRDSGSAIIHRGDHASSGWALARGRNTLTLKLLVIHSLTVASYPVTGTAIVNYHCDRAAAGPGAHAHTVRFPVATPAADAGSVIVASGPSLGARRVFGVAMASEMRSLTDHELVMQTLAGEPGYPAKRAAHGGRNTNIGENGHRLVTFDVTSWLVHPAGDYVGSSRSWSLAAPSSDSFGLTLMVALHGASYVFAGTISVDGAAPADGTTVDVFESATGLKVGSGTTTAGAYSVAVYDDTVSYYASFKTAAGNGSGRTAASTPGTGKDITTYTVGGGGGLNVHPIGSPIIKVLP